MQNDLNLLISVLNRLSQADIAVWLFGGWAEELCGLCEQRNHVDVDLLYPADDFSRLDAIVSCEPDWLEIEEKRFSHKRASRYFGVMVEFLLVRREADGLTTEFFNGITTFRWPNDTLASRPISIGNSVVNVAGHKALTEYRAHHAKISTAYRQYAAEAADRDSDNHGKGNTA